MARSEWQVVWEACPRERAGHEATVFTCSNGYLATRGTHPERDDGLPALTVAGIFTDDRHGFRTLVSCGQWLGVSLRSGRRQLDPGGADVSQYRRVYDLKSGTVQRRLAWALRPGAQLAVETEHFTSLAAQRVGLQRYRMRAAGGPVRVRLSAWVTARARTRGEYLLAGYRVAASGPWATIEARTAGGDHQVALRAGVRVDGGAAAVARPRAGGAEWVVTCRLAPGEALTLTKVIGVASDRDAGPAFAETAGQAAEAALARGFDAERARHAAAWARLWRDADLRIDGDAASALALRYVTAQLLGHAPRADDRVSLAAKPLSAEGYRGHVFWDTDLFMMPAVTALRPELGRRLVNYRWEMLPGARRNAARWGYGGAWYPWESADDGSEATPRYWVHADGRRMPITCWKYEIHSVCDVAYAAWDYWLATGDEDWLYERGVEILVETARFWASRARWVARRRRFEIHDVCGPDECHERVNNSAYINVLAAWNIRQALAGLAQLRSARPEACRALWARLDLSRRELAALGRLAARLYIPRDRRTGWYRQFDGFESLTPIDPATAAERFEEPPDAARTQVIKQADVIMLLYLLRDRHTRSQMQINWDYYVPRTQHGTSLSAATHAAVAARLGLPRTALRYFTEAVQMDLADWRGDSERGLHGAALGGAICAALFGFGGLQFHADRLSVDPILPPGWRRLRLPFSYRGRRLLLDVRPEGFRLRFRGHGAPLSVETGGRRRRLRPGQVLAGELLPAAGQAAGRGRGARAGPSRPGRSQRP